ncbi:hypothetical protein C1H46_035291 [Malus baccata]|uniref:Uncharacterized protein n=1 Tax=Malus baccata TaxID=106549 RepID=A0A540KY57_MALBA|nr:hypothetical protein C1H46_035291 [Malus baccata]
MSLGAPPPPRSGPTSKSRESSPEPLRWAPLVCDDDSITNNSRTVTPMTSRLPRLQAALLRRMESESMISQ